MKTFFLAIVAATLMCCAPDKPKVQEDFGNADEKNENAAKEAAAKGIGQIQNVTLNTPLEQDRIGRGKAIYEMKCQACHRVDTKRVVGPGWKDVTIRRKPEWIMNMIMNPAEMTQKDETAKSLLAEYMTQMSVIATEEDARAILEYFRKLDG